MPATKASSSIRSTDRGGAVTLTAGILSLALGFGLLIGITLQTTAHTVVMFKDMALGLGGALYSFVPFAFLWMGWLLCASARRYVSFRAFLITFMLYMGLLALVTMLTTVTGFGTLMQYIRDANMPVRSVSRPDSYGAYLMRAYQRYNNQLNPLPGGGAMGMLVAFPVWKILGQVGGVIFLCISMIVLLFALFRINPVLLYQRFEAFLQGRGKRVPEAEPQLQQTPQEQPAAYTPQPDTAYQPQVEPYYVEPQPDPFRPAAGDGFASPLTAYQPAAWQPPVRAERPEDEGFTAVEQDFYERADENPAVSPRSGRSVRRETVPSAQLASYALPDSGKPSPASAGNEQKDPIPASRAAQRKEAPAVPQLQPNPNSPASSAPESLRTPPVNEMPRQPEPIREIKIETSTAVPEHAYEPASSPKQDEKRVPARPAFSSSRVNEVGVASAVPLTGERISVKPAATPIRDARQDGMAVTKPAARQTSMHIDSYQKPTLRLISAPPPDANMDTSEEDAAKAEKLISTLASFNISATVNQVVHGPAVTSFGIRLAEGVNINKLRNVMDNISVELLAKSPARAEIPIPGTPLIGIEVSNEKASMVYLSEVLSSPKMQELKSPTAVSLGKDIYGAPVICELMDMPHLLIAGATGSGKSVCINSIITSLLYRASPKEVRLILIDPKFVELQPYNDGPHLLLPVVVDPKKSVMALEWVCQEMDERYKILEKHRVRNIDAYNAKLEPEEEPMPRIIIIVDEMADLMLTAGKAIDEHIKRITAKARAAGICLILATQRPSVDVITGIIKANIPSRIAFQVSSQIDSRTILDSQGAEKLLGYGDMLYFPRTLKAPKRVQGCFISDSDVASVADYVKSHNRTEYNMEIMEHIQKEEKKEAGGSAEQSSEGEEGEDSFDELLPKAIEMAVEAGQMSISMLQRVLRVGYGRAGRLIDEMARRSIISGNEGTKPRKTLITREEYRQLFEDDVPF